jgi:hypothetical protein
MKPIGTIGNYLKIYCVIISSVGQQVQSRKSTEPRVSVGKSTRDKDRKLGMFPSMMSKQPTKISIPHPKI